MHYFILSLGLIAAGIFAPRASQADAVVSSGLIDASLSCKPATPIGLELLSSRISNGILQVEYQVRPSIAARDFSVEVIGDLGTEVLRQDLTRNFQLEQGAVRSGSARVRLPSDFKVRGTHVQIRVGCTFDGTGDDGSTGVERIFAARLLQLGATSEAAQTELVMSGTDTSLDMPASRTGPR